MLQKLSSMNPFRKEDPKELVRKWKTSIRAEVRSTEREMTSLIAEQKKAAVAIKEAAGRNDMVSAKVSRPPHYPPTHFPPPRRRFHSFLCPPDALQMLAKAVVRLRATVARLAANKANLLALSNEMTQMLAMQRAAGTIQSSSQLMATMNGLIKVPQLHANMKDMAREMARAGFIQEAMGDAMDVALDSESVEEEAAEAVDQVLMEITGETMAQLGAVPSGRVGPQAAAVDAQEEAADDDLMERLAGLKAAA